MPPWKTGWQQKAALSLFELILLTAFCLMPNAARAAETAINYQLLTAFDLPAHLLKATASITLPPGAATVVYLDGLRVTAIELNSAEIKLPGSTLPIAASSSVRRLIIHYQKTVSSMHDGLIGETGIVLSDDWYPQLNSPALFHLQAVIPANFTAVSEADTISTESVPNSRLVTFEFSRPLTYLHFIAGPYVERKVSIGNGKSLYTYFFPEDAELAADYLRKGKAYIQRYEKLIGPYPYQRFSIVENRLPTGYAMPTFTLLGQAVVRLPFIVDTSLGHEILHSWFGNAIGVDYAQGNWCEGLTTYLADQSFAAERKQGAVFRKGQLIKFAAVNRELGGTIEDFKGGEASPNPQRIARRAVGYGKASMLFNMLRRKVGDKVFFAALRDFYRRMDGKIAGWRDIEQSFKNAGADDLKDFFKQWLTRKDAPDLKAENISLNEVDGRLHLKFTIAQTNKVPYKIEVPVVIVNDFGRRRETVKITDKSQKVELTLKQYPLKLVIDPDYDLMRTLGVDETPPVWALLAGADKITVVVAAGKHDLYAPYIKELEGRGAKIIADNEVTDKELAAGSLIFLGPSGVAARGLFANPPYPETGMTVDVRQNPLNPKAMAALIKAADPAELRAGLIKLRHYGKYSYLHFEAGHIKEKRITRAEMGRQYIISAEPRGVALPATVRFNRIVSRIVNKRVIYVGEMHTRYADHKLQLRVIRDLWNRGIDLALGMEMFPHSSQGALDDFVAGKINEAEFLHKSKYFKVWSFDYRLYREILNFARAHHIPVIALNISKDKVSKVYKDGGISGLVPEEKMALPLNRDLDVPGYRERLAEVFQMHRGGHGNINGFMQAQAIWDEVMAQGVAEYLKANPAKHMVVLAGRGHILKDQGIPLRVKRRLGPGLKQAVIINSDGRELNPKEEDFVVFSPEVQLPPRVLMGIVMERDEKTKEIKIEQVSRYSPAAQAGIKAGDVLLKLDDKPVRTTADVKIIMLGKKRGDKLTVLVRRHQLIFGAEKLSFALQL